MSESIEVLFVESSEQDQQVLQKLVSSENLPWAVVCVPNLEIARAKLVGAGFDIIIAEYRLADGVATDLFPYAGSTPFVFLTQALSEQLELRTLERRADDYLTKDSKGSHLRIIPLAVNKILHWQRVLDHEHRIKEQLRLLIEGVKDYALYMLDPVGRVTTWNEGAERILGYKSEIIGQHFSIFFPIEERDARSPQNELETARMHGAFHGDGWRIRKDGARFWASTTLTALRSEEGEIIGFVKVARDISERKRVEEELLNAKTRAEQANQAKDHFLAMLSHELRTPLTPVVAAVALLRRQLESRRDVEPTLEIIHRNVQLQARLIDDLLDLTRIVRGVLSLEWKPIDLSSLVERTVSICRADIERKQLQLSIETGEGPYLVCGDAARLQQICWNLLNNAIKFTSEGGEIKLSCYKESANAVLEVIDNGIGIDPQIMPRIFEAFEQGEKKVTRQFGGLGLGLTIAKRLVELHGGTIEAFSAGVGKGSRFKVTLPLLEQQQTSESVGAGEALNASALSVLLVEDHPDTSEMMRALLESAGYKVATAQDAASALELFGQRQFDILVSDLGLPDQSGLVLMQELLRRHSEVKAIAMSGFGQEEDVRKSKDAGFLAHITKPVDFDGLISTIERIARS